VLICSLYENDFLFMQAHPQFDAGDERQAFYQAPFCMFDHQAYCSVWDRRLMKSNAQLRFEGHNEAPQPPPVQVEIPT
jgi:ketosteroid isomerase-like protein